MKKAIKKCICGSVEFISEPTHYDYYEIISDDGLEVSLETIYSDAGDVVTCRECDLEYEVSYLNNGNPIIVEK